MARPNPIAVSAWLVVYCLGGGLLWVWLGKSIPESMRDLGVLADVLQVAYVLGAVALAYRLTKFDGFPNWLMDIGLIKSQAGYVIHGIITGTGIQIVGIFLTQRRLVVSTSFAPADVFLSCVLAPLAEGIVFQGALYQLYRARTGIAPSIFFVTLTAVLCHAWTVAPDIFGILWLSGGFSVFCLYRALSGSLWPAIACHSAANITGILFQA